MAEAEEPSQHTAHGANSQAKCLTLANGRSGNPLPSVTTLPSVLARPGLMRHNGS